MQLPAKAAHIPNDVRCPREPRRGCAPVIVYKSKTHAVRVAGARQVAEGSNGLVLRSDIHREVGVIELVAIINLLAGLLELEQVRHF